MARLLLALLLVSLMLPTGARAESSQWQVLLGGDDANTPRMPSGLAIDAQGSIYVVDTGGSRVERLTPTGHLIQTIGHLGTGDDGLRRPRGIALHSQGTLLVADTANHHIQRFSTGGEPLGPWGSIGSGPGEFILPTSLAFDSQSNLYVADTGNHRVQELDPDGRPLAAYIFRTASRSTVKTTCTSATVPVCESSGRMVIWWRIGPALVCLAIRTVWRSTTPAPFLWPTPTMAASPQSRRRVTCRLPGAARPRRSAS